VQNPPDNTHRPVFKTTDVVLKLYNNVSVNKCIEELSVQCHECAES